MEEDTNQVLGLTDAQGYTQITTETSNIIKELQSLVAIHNLLNTGLYPGQHGKFVLDALSYAENKHKELHEVLKGRPDYDALPAAMKEQSNGQT
jgi:hypothetical protein